MTEQSNALVIVDGDSLLRYGVRCFLAASHYEVQHECETLTKALELSECPVELIFVAISLDLQCVKSLRRIRAAFRRSRIVLYGDTTSLPTRQLVGLFGTCLDGCLTPGTPVDVLCRSLELIRLGQHLFPLDPLAAALPQAGRRDRDRTFSERERQVLQFLREGKSNKAIAGELGLSEASVKAHIKTLLRKLGAHNRTEAAIRALTEKIVC